MNYPDKKRLVWPDTIKGIAIWLMVFCHASVSNKPLLTFIYMFHMPVFFIISGYFDRGNELSWKGVKHAVMKLMIPYFIYNCIGFSVCWISPYLHPELYKGIVGFPSIFKAAFLGMLIMDDNITSFSFMPLGCMWFLVALFECKMWWMLFLFLWNKAKVLIILPMGVMSLICIYRPVWYSLDSAVYSLVFYGFGYLLRQYQPLMSWMRSFRILILVLLLSILYMSTLGMWNGKVDVDGCLFGTNIVLFYLGGIIGFFACFCAAELLLNKVRVFSEVGKVSMTILGTHAYFCIIGKFIAVILFHSDVNDFPLLASCAIACVSCAVAVWIKRMKLFNWLP